MSPEYCVTYVSGSTALNSGEGWSRRSESQIVRFREGGPHHSNSELRLGKPAVTRRRTGLRRDSNQRTSFGQATLQAKSDHRRDSDHSHFL